MGVAVLVATPQAQAQEPPAEPPAAEPAAVEPVEPAPPPPQGKRHRPFELGLYGGWYIFEDDHGLGRAVGDSEGLSPKDSFEIGLRIGVGWPNLGIEGEFYIVPTQTNDERTDMIVFGYRGHLILNIIGRGAFRPFILLGYGGVTTSVSDDTVVPNDTDSLLYGGAGFKLFLSPAFAIRIEGRANTPMTIFNDIAKSGPESAHTGWDFEVLGGLTVAFGGSEPAPVVVPPPPEGPKDSDGDGILDPDDKCPQEPEDRDGFQDEDGCPDPDNDQDGIPDASDRCPLEPEDKDSFQDEDGCPDPDNDGDGILDASDKCVNEPETKNNYQDDDGCPDTVPGPVQRYTGVIQGINFQTNSAVIKRNSFGVLDKAAQVLKDYPDVSLEIQGHTDDRGNDEFNKDLSQRRADSVKQYLEGKGIEAGRITAVGYGEEQPIADNKTSKGKAKNRRVEFKLK